MMEGQPREWPRLHRLAADGDVRGLLEELEKGTDANVRAEDGATALHVAAERAQAGTAKALLENGANPNARTMEHFTPLAAAGRSGSRPLVDALIAEGANPNDVDAYPLEEAILSGNAETVEALLVANADPNGPADEQPPLHLAAMQDARMVAALLRHGATAGVVYQGMTALHWVAQEMPAGAARIMRLLLGHGASQQESGGPDEMPPLQIVLEHDQPDSDCINVLLADALEEMDEWDGGLDGLNHNWTPLHAAAANPNIPRGVVETLIGPFGCDCEAESSYGTPLMLAAKAGSLTAMEELLDRGVDPNGEDDCLRPLACAIEGGQTTAVDALLKAGAKVDRHEHLDQALKRACAAWDRERCSSFAHSDVEMARMLIVRAIEAGDVMTQERDPTDRLDRSTPLHWAAASATDGIALGKCLRAREDVRVSDEAGWSPLHWAACFNRSASVLECLLDSGGDPDARTPDGKTAQEIARASGNTAAQQALGQDRGN